MERHYAEHLDYFDAYPYDIHRVDAARYFYLHHFGGVYMDADYVVLRSLEELPLANGEVVLGRHLNRSVLGSDGIGNTVMAAPPRHPFFAYVLTQLRRRSNIPDVIRATGPMFLTACYRRYLEMAGTVALDGPVALNSVFTAANISVHAFPRLYAPQWNKPNPCGRGGTPRGLEWCTPQLLLSGAMAVHFSTRSWQLRSKDKRRPGAAPAL